MTLLLKLATVCVIVTTLHLPASPAENDVIGRHHRVKRLIGGEGFVEGKWPWLVSLQGKVPSRMLYNIPLSYQRFYCGASLLNDRWILTAAHCFTETNLGERALTPRYWHAKLGEVELKTSMYDRVRGLLGTLLDVDDMKRFYLHAEKIVIHPNYTDTNMWKNDIALMKLERDVPSGIEDLPRIQKITLNSAGNMAFPPADRNCFMKGWGCTDNGGPVTQTAREIMLPTVSDEDCSQFWGIPASLRLCAGHSSTASLGICSGDSGGPLVCHNGAEWIQVGVASFTSASRPGNVPGVFTRVSSYVSWIRDVMVRDWAESLQSEMTTPAMTSPSDDNSWWSLQSLLKLMGSSDHDDDDDSA